AIGGSTNAISRYRAGSTQSGPQHQLQAIAAVSGNQVAIQVGVGSYDRNTAHLVRQRSISDGIGTDPISFDDEATTTTFDSIARISRNQIPIARIRPPDCSITGNRE